VLNIKLVVLNYEGYKSKDISQVLWCQYESWDENRDNLTFFQRRASFDPDYYVILEKYNHEYKLVSYKRKQIFLYEELPYDLRVLVVEKCMEMPDSATSKSLFALIADFRRFQHHVVSVGAETHKRKVEEERSREDLSQSSIRNLYDPHIVLQIHEHAADDPIPGRGAGEKMTYETMLTFANLQSVKQWRQKLDDAWLDVKQPFLCDGHYWNSVVHYIYANLFKKTNPTYYLLFTAESATPLSKNVEMAKCAGSVSGKYKGKRIRPADIPLDERASSAFKEKLLPSAYEAKFAQNTELRFALLETKTAKLVKFRKGKSPLLCDALMVARDLLRQQKQTRRAENELRDKILSPNAAHNNLLEIQLNEQLHKQREAKEDVVRKLLHL